MVLFLHHRYRIPGGEERAVDDLAWLVRTQLGETAEVLERDSANLGPARAAAGLLAGGLRPETVARAVRETGARIVHAHNLQPTLGWRALAAARAAGARIVVHLHQYRLVCAIGVCFRDGHECTECHGRDTRAGVRHNCRGGRAEALAYAGSLALWQRKLLDQADAIVVPSAFARERLTELGVDAARGAWVVPNVVRPPTAPQPQSDAPRRGALVVSRLSPEKGVDVAIEACAQADLPLTIAGDGPERAALERLAAASPAEVRLVGRVATERLDALRARAAVAVVPSRSAETFGLAAAEAMAAGLPVAASRIGALPELVPDQWLAEPGDPAALATVMRRIAGDPEAGPRAGARAQERCSPAATARGLAAAYDAAAAPHGMQVA